VRITESRWREDADDDPFACGEMPASTRQVGPLRSPQTSHLGVPEAVDEVIVDHAHGLHEGVADGRAHELEAAAR
jgi:hypothetical protein